MQTEQMLKVIVVVVGLHI